ncbi:MAG: type III pantothenate kinase [Polyangiales bacterium]
MLLVIDIGNTNTVLGLYEGEVLQHHFRVESAREAHLGQVRRHPALAAGR